MVLLQLLPIHDRAVGVTNLGVMLLWIFSPEISTSNSDRNMPTVRLIVEPFKNLRIFLAMGLKINIFQ